MIILEKDCLKLLRASLVHSKHDLYVHLFLHMYIYGFVIHSHI